MTTTDTTKTRLTFQGMGEPEALTPAEAVAMFRAAALLREPCTLVHKGRTSHALDTLRPDRLNEAGASAAETILLWRLAAVLDDLGVKYARIEGMLDGAALVEVGEYTIGVSYAPGEYRRAAEKWHVYDPEGDPILENATMAAAILEIWTRADRHKKLTAIEKSMEAILP